MLLRYTKNKEKRMNEKRKKPRVASLFATAQKGEFGQENEHENGGLRATAIPNLSAVFCLNYIFSKTFNNMQITKQKNHHVIARAIARSNPEIQRNCLDCFVPRNDESLNCDFNIIDKMTMIFLKNVSTTYNKNFAFALYQK